MKKLTLSLLLFALLAAGALAEGEDVYCSAGLYHATPLCALWDGDRAYQERLQAQIDEGGEVGEASRIIRKNSALTLPGAEARELGYFPCPVCVADGTDYGSLSAVERGGTAVLRVPDAWIESRERFDVFGTAGDEAYSGDAAQKQLARYLHGAAYVDFLEAARRDGEAEADVLYPGLYLDDDDLEMHARHLGGAWYIVLRPGEEARARMKKDGKLKAGLWLEGGPLLWEDGRLIQRSWGHHYEEDHDLALEALDGKPAFSGDFENLTVTLFREMDANILVLRESPGDGQWLEGALLALDDATAAEGLNGYLDGGDAVYVGVLSDAEADALKTGAFPRLYHPGRVGAKAATDDGWRLGYVSQAARDEGAYDYTVYFRDGEVWIANDGDAEEGPVSVYLEAEGRGDPGRPAYLDGVPLGQALSAFDEGDVLYRGNGEPSLVAWAAPGVDGGGTIISNSDRVWLAQVGDREIYTHTPLAGEGLEVFIDDGGSLYVQNHTGGDLNGATATLDDVNGMVDFIVASRELDLPDGGAALAFSADEIAALVAQRPGMETLYAQCDFGGDISDASAPAYVSSGQIAWRAALYGGASQEGELSARSQPGAAGDGLPAPARDLSFLSGYTDATQVGDWYLACTDRTDGGIYMSPTRNDAANWRLLDGAGNALAVGLRWWPKGDDWPLQPRPLEGFEEGAEVAVIRIGDKYGLIDRAGKLVAEAKYDAIFSFLGGDSAAPMARGGKWGCIDAAGNEVVPPVYDSLFSRFEGGCTVVERDGKKGLLGEDGTELLPAEYGTMWLDDGAEYGFARKGRTCLLFDRKGEILFERDLGKGSWIYCYEDAAPPFAYYNGETEKHGYLNLDGTDVAPAIFDDAGCFWGDAQVACVSIDGKSGLVRKDGSYAVEPRYDALWGGSEGLFPAQRGALWGYIDGEGREVVSFRFSYAGKFVNGYADASPEGNEALHGLIDRSGAWAVEPGDYYHVEVGADGVAVAVAQGEKRYFRLGEGGAEAVDVLDDAGEWDVPELDGAPALSLSGNLPHLDGVDRLYPLYAAFAKAAYAGGAEFEPFEHYRNHRGDPVLTSTDWDTAWERLASREADVIFVPAPEPEEPVWAMLAGRGESVEFIPVCREAMVFPVNANNPLEDVPGAALEAVYAGRSTDWGDLGAAGLGRILAYQYVRDYDDGTAKALFGRVCGFGDLSGLAEGVVGYDAYDGTTYVGPAPYRNLPNAVGCAPRLYCRSLLESGKARLLSVDGVAPTDENIANGSYPYAETLYAVYLSDNDEPNVKALLDWIQSEQGKALVEKAGYAAI